MPIRTRTATRIRVTPRKALLADALAAVLLGTAPLLGVAYWFASSRGFVPLVHVASALVIATILVLGARQLRVFCAVTETHLVGNGIFTPVVRVPLEQIHEVQLVPTWLGAAPDPVHQLVALDADGRTLFRMRGNYWHDEDLAAVAAALPVRTERVAEAMTVRDFLRAYPGAAFWFERHAAVKGSVILLAVVAGAGIIATIMQLLGLPVRFLP